VNTNDLHGLPDEPMDYNAMADYLRERLEKLSQELGNGGRVVQPMLAIIEDLRLHSSPDQDILTANALAQRTLRRMTWIYQHEDDYPDEWLSEATD